MAGPACKAHKSRGMLKIDLGSEFCDDMDGEVGVVGVLMGEGMDGHCSG